MPPTTPRAPVHPRAIRLLAPLASLRLAIVLLALFAACLAGATLLESVYSARAAQDLVYRTWWFALLLALLAANVVGAALKKYPWKRHQTGFLITHSGLLVLLLGGLLTSLFGVEGQMVLIDTPDPALQARIGLANQARSIHLADTHEIEIYCLRRRHLIDDPRLRAFLRAVHQGEEVPDKLIDHARDRWSLTFRPGPFTWYSDEHARIRLPWPVRLLHGLASPWPGYTLELGEATFSVDNFYPHAEYSPHGEGRFIPREGPGEEMGLEPAVRCCLSARGERKPFWIGLSRGVVPVAVGDDLYLFRYHHAILPVDFALTLRRAWEIKDPGTQRPAWFQSDVSVTGLDNGSAAREHRIVMNQPLTVGPYRVYQANYRALIDPRTGQALRDGPRLISLSGLAVARNPGLWLEYAGAGLVALGIAAMFYMKAYFFQPRGRASPPA
jgi:hypothetical protein